MVNLGRLTKMMRELILCFTQQGLNEFPWGISLQEYLRLEEIEEDTTAQ